MDEQPADPIAALGSPRFLSRPIWPTSRSWCMWCGEEYSDDEHLPGPLCFAKGVEAYRAWPNKLISPSRSEVLDGAKEAVSKRHEQYSSGGDAFEAGAALKAAWRQFNHGKNGPAHDEAIEMILHKIGRIATGEVAFLDNYVDIAGYGDRAYQKAVAHKEKGA